MSVQGRIAGAIELIKRQREDADREAYQAGVVSLREKIKTVLGVGDGDIEISNDDFPVTGPLAIVEGLRFGIHDDGYEFERLLLWRKCPACDEPVASTIRDFEDLARALETNKLNYPHYLGKCVEKREKAENTLERRLLDTLREFIQEELPNNE